MDTLRIDNRIFNDSFFLMLNDEPNTKLFPIWKDLDFRLNPVDKIHRAQEKINEYLKINPDNAKALFMKGVIFRSLNFNDESTLYFQEAKERDVHFLATNIYLAEYFMYKLKFSEAISLLDEVEDSSNSNQRVKYLKALAHLELFDFKKARTYLNQLHAISLDDRVYEILVRNIAITKQIIDNAKSDLILKNFKLKSLNYNLQLKTNLINFYQKFKDQGLNFDMIGCLIICIYLKNMTTYEKKSVADKYNVSNILNYIKIEKGQAIIDYDKIDFENDFLKTYNQYKKEMELQKEEEF